MFLVGKLAAWQEDTLTLPAGSTGSSLLYLQDKLSSCQFLVGSGASASLFQAPPSTSISGVKLLTADGSTLACSGSRIIPLRFGTFSFEWLFQLAPVSVPVLGVDFLHHHNLLLDVANQKVFSSSSPSLCLTSSPPLSSSLRANHLSTPKCIPDLLSKFTDVLSSNGFTASRPCHQIRHCLLTHPRPPVFAKSCCLDPDKLAVAKDEFSAMEKAGIICPSTLPWSSPLYMAKKKYGGWRPCGDYRRLNNVTILDWYPLPNITNFTSRISGSTVFSKLYLHKGYYQVLVATEDIQKTAIITLFRMFEFLRMPFGLRNAGNTFQSLMDQVLGDLPFCLVYVDDLREIFLLYCQHGLMIGLPKCKFSVSKIEFLGHLLTTKECSPLTKHIAITAFPPPSPPFLRHLTSQLFRGFRE